MTISGFIAYVKQIWKNKPDRTTPITAAALTHMEEGIKNNSDAINAIAEAVVDNITNDPNKIASMAALYSVKESVSKNATAIETTNSNLGNVKQNTMSDCNNPKATISGIGKTTLNTPYTEGVSTAVNGLVISTGINQSIWNGQLAIENIPNPNVFVRGADGSNFSKWTALAKKSNLDSYAPISNFINFKVFKLSSLSQLDESVSSGDLVIRFNIIDSVAYISFDILWIRLQFKIVSSDTLKYRIKYGKSNSSDWKTL